MTTLVTQTDILAGAILLGASLVVLGAALLRHVAADRAVTKAVRTISETDAQKSARIAAVSRAAVVSPRDASGLDALWLELLMTPSVPEQRTPGGES